MTPPAWTLRVAPALLVVLYAVAPLVWLAGRSWGPGWPGASSYATVLGQEGFTRGLLNSAVVCLLATAVAMLLGTPAAYAVARLRFWGRRSLVVLALLVAMLPQVSLAAPVSRIEDRLGLSDTWAGLVLPYTSYALPLAVYVLTAFFSQIPRALERAALVDGATPMQAFRRVFVPMARPALLTTAIVVFVACWNDYVFALSLTSTDEARTAPVALAALAVDQPAAVVAAGALVLTLPVLVLVLAFQSRLVAGLTAGALRA